MSLSIQIAGVERAGLLLAGSLGGTDTIQNRSTLKFRLSDESGFGYRPQEGQPVIVEWDGERIYKGSIDKVKWKVVEGTTDGGAQGTVQSEIDCVDRNQVADRHVVARVYENMLAGDIIRDIVANDLAGEGIQTQGEPLSATGSQVGTGIVGSAVVGRIIESGVSDGPMIERAVFNYMTASQVFSELAELVGYYWNIDHFDLLTFAPREQIVAPFQVGEVEISDTLLTQHRFRNMDVEDSRDQYRNKQFLRAGTEITDPRTEDFKGDGATQAFLLAFPAAREPSVTVNGVAKTVGIKGVDPAGSHDWYWNAGNVQIVQDDGAVPLTTTDTLSVTYQGSFPIVIGTADSAEIAARAAVEGGTGVYEDVAEDATIDSMDLAIDKAGGLLRKYGRVPRRVTFEIDHHGLKPGQLLTMGAPLHEVTGPYLVESVGIQDVPGRSDYLKRQVTILSGEHVDNWIDFFRKLANSGRRFNIRENERLTQGQMVVEVLQLSDVLDVAQAGAIEAVVGSAIVGYSEVGAIGVTVNGSIVGAVGVGGEAGLAVVGTG